MTLSRHYTIANSFGDSIRIDIDEARDLLALLVADLGHPQPVALHIAEPSQSDYQEDRTVEPEPSVQEQVSQSSPLPKPKRTPKARAKAETFEEFCCRKAIEHDGDPKTVSWIQASSYRKPWGKKSYQDIRDAIAAGGIDLQALRDAHDARRDAKRPKHSGVPEVAPSATDEALGIEGTIGQRAARVLELAADGVEYELIANQTGFKTEKVIQFCAENQSRIRRIASFTDPALKAAYVQGVALGFNKRVGKAEQGEAAPLSA